MSKPSAKPWVFSKHAVTSILAANGRRHVCTTAGYSSNAPGEDYAAENEANARHILHCVNLHDELVRIAKMLEAAYLDGNEKTFHARLNEMAGGNFGLLLGQVLDAEAKGGSHEAAA